MPILLFQRKVCVKGLKLKFTGASFYNPANKSFEAELYSDNGQVASDGEFDKEVTLPEGFVFPAFRCLLYTSDAADE